MRLVDDLPPDPMADEWLASLPQSIGTPPAEPEPEKPPPTYTTFTGAELLEMEIEPPEMIIEPWLQARSTTMIAAWRGVGKSWVQMTIGVLAAWGGEALGWSCQGGHRVLYIDGELTAGELQERQARVMQAVSSREHSKGDIGLITYLAKNEQDVPVPSLATDRGQDAVRSLTEQADLILVDNIATLCQGSGKEDNSVESWEPVQTWTLEQRRAGRTVVFCHHTSKNGSPRGTSAKEDILHNSIILKYPEGGPEDHRLHAILEWSKNRGGNAVEPIEIKLREVGDQMRWIWNPAEDERIAEAREMRRSGKSIRAIEKELGVPRSTVNRWVKEC